MVRSFSSPALLGIKRTNSSACDTIPHDGWHDADMRNTTRVRPPSGVKRRDAAQNVDRILAAASHRVRDGGSQVPMATIAAEAGVGVGTLYRHFPNRTELLKELAHRSFLRVLDHADDALRREFTGIDAIRAFLAEVITDRDQLNLLPLHGGPPVDSERTRAVQRQIHNLIAQLLSRGHDDGTVKPSVTAADIIVTGALLAQRLPHIVDWNRAARRHLDTYLCGLRPHNAQRP